MSIRRDPLSNAARGDAVQARTTMGSADSTGVRKELGEPL